MSNPYLQLFPNDYLSESSLIGLDYFEHGVWFHMMLLMVKSAKTGYICDPEGGLIDDDFLLCLLPCGERSKVKAAIEKLEKRKVFSRTPEGMIFSRRIIRDEQKRQASVEYGRMGGKLAHDENKSEPDLAYLISGGLTLDKDDWKALREFYRGVDFGKLVKAAVEANKVSPIANVRLWLSEAAKAAKEEGLAKEGVVRKKLRVLFGRRLTTPWSKKEIKALAEVERREDAERELDVITAHYEAMRRGPADKNYCRRDIVTLLNNWTGELDRASGCVVKKTARPLEENRVLVVTQWCERLEAIAKDGGFEGQKFREGLSSVKGSFDKMGKNEKGQSVADEIMEILMFRKESVA